MIIETKEQNAKQLYYLTKDLPDKLVNSFIDHKVIIAGGAVRASFAGEKISDYDLYLPNEEFFKSLVGKSFSEDAYFVCATANAVTYKLDGLKFQLIRHFYNEKSETPVADLLNVFDFTVCQGAFSFIDQQFYFSENFLKDICSRSLIVNKNLEYPLSTLFRTYKYIRKGYNLSPVQVIGLSVQCADLNLETYADYKKHILGIDSLTLTKMFDKMNDEQLNTKVSSQVFIQEMDKYLSKVSGEDEF